MRITAALGLGFALLATTGCVTLWTWERPDTDEAQTRRDVDLCQQTAKAPRVPRPFQMTGAAITSVPYEDLDRVQFDACMKGKGYTRLVP